MAVLVHLSDLHFGRVDERLLDPLVAAVTAARPDVVVISGDLTQRAKRPEFEAARAFIARLPGPRVIVPGNHDVPLYNVVDRFLRPLARFRRGSSGETYAKSSQESWVSHRIAARWREVYEAAPGASLPLSDLMRRARN